VAAPARKKSGTSVRSLNGRDRGEAGALAAQETEVGRAGCGKLTCQLIWQCPPVQVQARAHELKILTRSNASVLSPFEAEALRSTIASSIRELCFSGIAVVAVSRTFPGYILEVVKELPGDVSDYDDDRQAAMAEIMDILK
jgi:hypothetical protein